MGQRKILAVPIIYKCKRDMNSISGLYSVKRKVCKKH